MKPINVSDFTEFPGPRFEKHGPFSGERFRREILLNAIAENAGNICINLDGVIGYGSSFLEEAFGGLIRDGIPDEIARQIAENIVSDTDPSLKLEIQNYIQDAIANKNKIKS